MINTSARLLRLVALLATRPSWTNSELAARLEITERTVRRDVAKLRDLGYAIESDPGPWGGYRLSGGTRVPPLSLDDEEALAVAVALREAAFSGVLGDDQAALSALLKLQRLLPAHISDRLGELDSAFEHTPRSDERHITANMLLELATACRRGERLQLIYRDRAGRGSTREVDPHRLVRTSHRWYLVALDVARGEWRTFRADRVVAASPTGQPAQLADPPDAAQLVARMLTSDYPLYATIRLPVPPDEAKRIVPPGRGVHEPDGAGATTVTIGGTDLTGLVRYLLGLATELRILSPPEVQEAFRLRLCELLNADGTHPGAGSMLRHAPRHERH
ncbi:helix-turn-helix transcriptional regulator [Streptomyces solisilvae]|uniref:helix-turn-helix transcriptional regulator n=1 Tax=Streptomyces malaysiensis TaxID=92644 RepID=UPI0036B9C219